MEGWEAWDIALRCAGQLRMAQFAVVGIDMGEALKVAEALGHNTTVAAELLPSCEVGLVKSINEKLTR